MSDVYLISWHDEEENVENQVRLEGYGAKLIVDLLKKNNYEYTVKKISNESKIVDITSVREQKLTRKRE